MTWLANLILLGLVLGGFLRFLDAQFAGTDSLTLAVSNRVASPADLLQLFTIPVMPGTSFEEGERIYRPAASVTFAVDGAIWALNPVGFHLTNVLLHALGTLGVFALARRLGAGTLAACIGTAVFAVHPAMVAGVPVISRRDNIVSAAPFVWSMVLLAGVCPGSRSRRWRLGGALLLYAVALLGKESGFATLPLVPLIALLSSGGRDWRRAVVLSVPFAAVWLALFVMRWLVLGSLGGYVNAPVGRLDTHAYVVLLTQFIRYALWPFVGVLASDSRGWLLLAVVLFGGAVALAWKFPRPARDLVWLGCAWTALFVVFYLVVRTLSGAWLMYYPLIGVALIIAGIVDAAWQTRARASLVATGVAAVFASGVLIASPLLTPYPEWRLVGETSQRYVSAAVACLADAADGTRVLLDRPPGFLNYPGQRNDLLVPVVVADYTVISALQVAYPSRSFAVSDNGFGDINGPPDRLQVSCDGSGAERVIRASY